MEICNEYSSAAVVVFAAAALASTYVWPLTCMQLAASDVLGIAVELSLDLPCRTSDQFC